MIQHLLQRLKNPKVLCAGVVTRLNGGEFQLGNNRALNVDKLRLS